MQIKNRSMEYILKNLRSGNKQQKIKQVRNEEGVLMRKTAT